MIASSSHRSANSRLVSYGHARPLPVRHFMLVALAIVLAAGVTMLVISQASANEVAGAFVPAAMTENAVGIAALASLLVSSVAALLLVLTRRPRARDAANY